MRNPLASQAGFTLIEMATIIVMIGILATIMFANTQTGNRRQQLRDAAQEYVSAAHQAESLASSAEAIDDGTGQKTSRKAYGVCVTSSQITDTQASPNRCGQPASGQTADMFQIYARDLSETSALTALRNRPNEPEVISSGKLPKDYAFSESDTWVDYVPPAPTLYANGQKTDRQLIIKYNDVTINECPGNSDCRYIQVKPLAGAVYVN